MSAALERSLLAALAHPVGAPLARVMHAPFVTALVADRDGGEAGQRAVGIISGALARCGIAPGRQIVLLATDAPPLPDARAMVRHWRAALGLPVVVHDPERAAWSRFGEIEGLPIELDDELREVEAVVAVSALRPGVTGVAGGGAALLVPGLASPATREAFAGREAGDDWGGHVRVDFALCWDADDPTRAWAGEAPAVWRHALGDRGWRQAPRNG